MPQFPDYAKILLAGYTESADYGVLRTDMDGGIAKQRPRWTAEVRTRNVNIHVDTVEAKRDFEVWVRDDLNRGVSWFDWDDPVSGETKQARIVGGKLEWTSPGKVWRAAAQIETVG